MELFNEDTTVSKKKNFPSKHEETDLKLLIMGLIFFSIATGLKPVQISISVL